MSSYKYDFKRFWLYDLTKILTWWTWYLWLRPSIHFVGENARTAYRDFRFKGGLLIASNHESFLDSVYNQMLLFMRHHLILSAKDVLETMSARKVLRLYGTVELSRDKPSATEFRSIVSDLKRGFVVNVFPEGTVTDGEGIQDLKDGVILMAGSAGVPILPCYVTYSRRLRFYVGEPLLIDKENFDKEKRKEASLALKHELEAMRQAAHAGEAEKKN